MRSSLHVGRILTLLVVLLVAPVWTSYGQPGQPQKGGETVQPELTIAPTPPVDSPTTAHGVQQNQLTYLPLVCGGGVSATPIVFGTGINGDGSLTNQGATFNRGIPELYNAATIQRCGNPTYRMEWTWPDGAIINVTDTVPPLRTVYTKILYVEPDGRPSGLPLPPGTYTARLFINEQLLQQATATIR